ncbi:HD-GYP domain-containing protein [Deinococcus lacus]|uniref:HD-GYP domain-containing protein n=1 Tax=Deinococcus lacus TaxID=392561 RepID=A0ABW1Y9B3_9DEIO
MTLRTLGSALEHRDNETSGHTERVVSLSVRLGQRLGWSPDQVLALRWGAYLHDLGKIAIPDAILHKAGPLSGPEMQIMQSHPRIGYDLLQNLPFLPSEALDLVRYHHEKWDGSGYPAGLRGKEIPETARIFSIVDVFDALTSARPYKAAWTHEQALAEMRKQSGKQFDPELLRAFARMIEDESGTRLIENR